jgi:hypothetical protein
MRLSLAARVALSTLCLASYAVLGAACGAGGSSGTPSVGSGATSSSVPDSGADAGDAGPVAGDINFVPTNDPVTLEPKATRVLTVATTPPGVFPVRFALLGSGATSPGDAALDASEVATDDSGLAHVTLTASSSPTTFTVRASIGTGHQATIGISVSARGYTTLRVLPSYSGKRPRTQWTATVRGGITCAQLVGDPPPDGDLSTTAAMGEPLDIKKVPIGLDLAVTLRAGHYIGGCADQSALSEADGNQVLVYASDRPLNLAATQLDMSFGPSNPSSALSKLLSGAAVQAETALSNGATSDVTGLLDAMRDATAPASRDAFSATRVAHTWDAALGAAFGEGAATRLRAPAERWFSAGLARFYTADTFMAQLAAVKNGALLSLLSVAQIPATAAGFPTTFQTTWSADANDTLLLGTELDWVPSRLVTALAILPATLDFPQALTAEAALAQSVDCGLVGTTLLAHGAAAGTTYDACDESCATTACVAAVSALWKKAENSSGTTSAALTVTGTGAAQVGDDASVISLDGSWVGQLHIGTDTAPASGALSAQATGAPSN